MSEIFLNTINAKDCLYTEAVDSVITEDMTYGYGDEIYKVTRLEILNGGTINLYGTKLEK